MTIKFDKVKKNEQNDAVTEFGDLCLGETFMYGSAYSSDGLDLEGNILYIKTDYNAAIEINHLNKKCVFENVIEVVAVDLEVSSVKLKENK
mgnify:CR=1 FL=1